MLRSVRIAAIRSVVSRPSRTSSVAAERASVCAICVADRAVVAGPATSAPASVSIALTSRAIRDFVFDYQDAGARQLI